MNLLELNSKKLGKIIKMSKTPGMRYNYNILFSRINSSINPLVGLPVDH